MVEDGIRKGKAEMIDVFVQHLEKLHGEVIRTDTSNLEAELKTLLADVSSPIAFQSDRLPDGSELKTILSVYGSENVLNVATWEGERGQFKKQLAACSVAITLADYLLCDTGTAVLLEPNQKSRLLTLLPEWLILIVEEKNALADLPTLYQKVEGNTSQPFFVTGPSRTADIEKQLVLGVHGPKRLTVIIVNDS